MDSDSKNYGQTFSFLSEVYEVVKSFDKVDKNPTKLNNKVTELKNKFEKAKQVINNMNGIQMSYIEQQEYYKSLLKQYELKLNLLENYKTACSTFDTSEIQLDDSMIMTKNESFLKLNFNDCASVEQKINSATIEDEQDQIDLKSNDNIEMDFGNI